MGKYYIKAVEPDNLDLDPYFDESDIKAAGIVFTGNDEYKEINDDIVKDIRNCIDDYFSELARNEDDLVHTIRYLFTKTNKAPVSLTEARQIATYCNEYQDASKLEDELEIICKILTITQCKKYLFDSIRGYSQGDWQYVLYPEVNEKQKKYYSSLYFGTGTEFIITTDKHNEEPEDIYDEDTYFDWCPDDYTYNDDKIKEWASKNIGCKPEDIEIIGNK